MQHYCPVLRSAVLLGITCLALPGCNLSSSDNSFARMLTSPSKFLRQHTERRLIAGFTEALAEDNESAFRRVVSSRFESVALRSPTAFRDLDILDLPSDKLQVVEVSDADGVRRVVAELEEGTNRYQFVLIDDPQKNRWCIDDVELRQRKRGTRDTRSSVELMDLLLTLREYLNTMENGTRQDLLTASAPELNEALGQLPDSWYHRLISSITDEFEEGMARRPKIDIAASEALGSIPSRNGVLRVKVERSDDRWLVSNVELQQRREEQHPGSLLRQCRAMNCISGFLNAYNETDRVRLATLSEEKFFQNSLRIGNLEMVTLPQADHAPDDFQIQAFSGQLTVMVPFENQICRFDLMSMDHAANTTAGSIPHSLGQDQFLVSDVMIYDRATNRQRNLRLAFTAPARAVLFVDALASANIPMLRQISSREMNEQVWNPLSDLPLTSLPLPHVPRGPLELQDSIVSGDSTELQFIAEDGRHCSILMEEQNGNLLVTDFQYPGTDKGITSLQNQLRHTVPLIQCAAAWENGSLNQVKATTSAEFERLVWSNMEQLPQHLDFLPQVLKQNIRSIQQFEDHAIVELGRRETDAVVRLVGRRGSPAIDEITVFQAGGQAINLRDSLRYEIASSFLNNTGRIRRAGFEETAADAGVIHALGQETDRPPRRGTRTAPSFSRTAPGSPLDNALDMTELQSPEELPDDRSRPASNTPPRRNRSTPQPELADETGDIHFLGADQRKPQSEQFDTTRPAARPVQKTGPRDLRNLSDHAVEIPLNFP